MTTDLPEIITTYQHAHDGHDTDAAIAIFRPDATVIDDGRTDTGTGTGTGTEEIRAWLDRTANEYTDTRTLTGVDDHGDGAFTVGNHLEGNFPGGRVDLRYRFELDGGRIRSLHIAP